MATSSDFTYEKIEEKEFAEYKLEKTRLMAHPNECVQIFDVRAKTHSMH